MELLGLLFGPLMRMAYIITKDYGLAIILFTILTKIVLMPISIWVQKNSIKMVEMQPEINRIKINHFGDKDAIADKESKLYKEKGYSPLASLIPLALQIVLLMGVIEVIYHPLTYVLKNDEAVIEKMNEVTLSLDKNIDPDSSSLQLFTIEKIQNGYESEYTEVNSSLKEIKEFDMKFLGFDLSWVTIERWGITILAPLLAGLSSLVMSACQNHANVLQSEQGNLNKYGMLVLSVALSLYLGMFVPSGVALYWVVSNIIAIATLYGLNYFINPKKYVDYEALNETSKELKELEASTKKQRRKYNDPLRIREKNDYNRFFSIDNKHVVFYSESNGFYKYYAGTIEYILEHTNIPIHYITSDPNDNIFNMAKDNEQIQAYFIEETKLITLMMKMDADIVLMTMPDLGSFHIKRSYVKKDIEYIYIPHGIGSHNMLMREHSLDHYDTLFAASTWQRKEEEETEEVYNLKEKKIIDVGLPLLDDMIEAYSKDTSNKEKMVLIAPSWQKDNIVDSCLEELLESLRGNGYKVVVRPHPQHVRHMPEKMEKLKEQFKDADDVIIQTDFSNTNTVFEADLLITDWSDVGTEFIFTTLKPVIYVDTPMKVMNPEWKRIKEVPLNIWIREEAGKVLKLDEISKANEYVEYLLEHKDDYYDKLKKLRDDNVYNIGNSGAVGARYIIDSIFNKIGEGNE